jgi:hypothetical protein
MTEFIGGEPRSAHRPAGANSWPPLGLWSLHGLWLLVVPRPREQESFSRQWRACLSFERGVAGAWWTYPEAGWAFIPDAWGKGLCDRSDDGGARTGADTALKRASAKSAASSTRGNHRFAQCRGQAGFSSNSAESPTTPMGRIDLFIHRRERESG